MGSEKLFSADEILTWRRKQLSIGGRAVDLDWLLDIGGGLGWSNLQKLKIFQNIDFELDLSLEELASLWERHLNFQIPLQYLLGKCPWRDFELEVTSDVLIPRQETELLVDIALNNIEKNLIGRWADLGTGSGVLAVALSRSLPNWRGHAVDISQGALSIAEKNLNSLTKQRIDLHLGSWWEPLKPWWGKFDLVVANPPYIPSLDLHELEPVVRNHEPHLALCGGDDGMDCCREIIQGSIKGLAKGGWLIFEHHHDQSQRAMELMDSSGFIDLCYKYDLQGIRRFAIGINP